MAKPKKSELDLRMLAEDYGLSYDEIQAVPALKQLFQDAVAGDWNRQKFTAMLKNSDWWKNTSDSARKFIDLQTTDPATWKAKWDETAFRMNQLAIAAGVGDLIGTRGTDIKNMSQVLKDATWAAFAGGWTDERLKAWFGGQAQFKTGTPLSGEAGRTYSQLISLAYANGRAYQDNWYSDWIKKIQGGSATIEQAEQEIRKQAAAEYGAFSKQILAGQNVIDVAAPYMKSVSDLLEIPQGALSLTDPLMRKALTTTGKDGGAYSLWQLENDVRSDERWRMTKNAQDSLMQLGHNVLTTFGFTF